jgi:hypothetical protein
MIPEFSSLFDLIGVPGFNYLDSKLLKIAGGFISQLRVNSNILHLIHICSFIYRTLSLPIKNSL